MPLVSYVQISTASRDGAGMVPTRCTIPDSTEEASSKAESGIAKKTMILVHLNIEKRFLSNLS